MPESIQIVEALLFATDSPVEPERIREVLELPSASDARAIVEELRLRYDAEARPLMIVEVGGGYRMVTRAELHPWLVRLARSRSKSRLSRPAMETLAIVAYRQPISRPEIDLIRGVNSDGVLDHLLERRMVRISGRKDAPGRPFLYETTREFLVAFGLRDLSDLPSVARVENVLGDTVAGEPAGEREPDGLSLQDDASPLQGPGGSRAGLATGE